MVTAAFEAHHGMRRWRSRPGAGFGALGAALRPIFRSETRGGRDAAASDRLVRAETRGETGGQVSSSWSPRTQLT